MRQYDLWWAKLPAPIGTRPVLLLSRSGAYEYLNQIIAAEVTTKIRTIPQEVMLGRREGMPRACVANLDNVRIVPVSALVERAGGLAASRHLEVKRAFGFVLGWPEITELW